MGVAFRMYKTAPTPISAITGPARTRPMFLIITRLLHFHKIADQTPDLAVPHVEDITENEVRKCAIRLWSADGSLGDYRIVGLDQPADSDHRVPGKPLVHDVLCKAFLTMDMKRARDHPFNIVG